MNLSHFQKKKKKHSCMNNQQLNFSGRIYEDVAEH